MTFHATTLEAIAAMAKPVRRHPIQNLAVMPMNKAASAKSAPICRGSPR